MAWYFQASAHDTHDWDSTQVPVLIDGEIDGRPRKLLALAGATVTTSCSTGPAVRTSSARHPTCGSFADLGRAYRWADVSQCLE